jgi:tetratricopeptide (TPR) repeat protein
LLSLALAAVTLLVYCRAPYHDFVNLDDRIYVENNPHVAAGLTRASLWWALTSFECSNWHPLTWLSLQLDRNLYDGLRPGGFHLTNVVLHLANSVLLLHVLRRMTGAVWRSALVAALFALHPLHVESVAWVAERKDVLSTLFWLLALLAYTWYAERPGPGRYLLVLLCLALGLMSKPMVVTLPCVLLLLDYWPLGRWAPGRAVLRQAVPLRWLVAEKLPLLGLAAASCLVTMRAQAAGGALASFETVPLDARFRNALQAYVAYLGMTAWPVNLAVFYEHPGAALSWEPALAAGALLLAITLGVLWARGRPYLAVGWLWYLGTLVPVIGLVQVGDQALADRYTYVPLIGIFIALAWGVGDLASAVGRRGVRVGLSAAAVTILAACALRTWGQLGTWHDSRTLWEQAVRVCPGSDAAHDHLGMVYEEAGLPQQAWAHFARAVELNPASGQARNNLGRACLGREEPELARRHLTEAVRLQPLRPDVHFNLALAHVLCPQRDLAAALAHGRRAVELKGDVAPAHVLLAYLCHELGQAREGDGHYREAIRLDPSWPERAGREAWQLAASRRLTRFQAALALLLARQVCQATGERRVEFLETRAAAEAAAGQYRQAARTLRQVLALVSERDEPGRYHVLEQQLRLCEEAGR